jgi:hypothetical protein
MTKTYTAYFYTDAEYASTEIEADTPEQALEKAIARYELKDGDGLIFDHYDEGQPVNHIEILDEDCYELAHWRDADLLLRMAAPEMLTALEGQTEAAQAVIDHWAKGDLAAAVRSLDAWIAPAREAIAKAKGEEP